MNPIAYLKQVYGLEEFINPSDQAPMAASYSLSVETHACQKLYAEKASLVFWSPLHPEDFSKNYRTLFEKIVTAMGLTLEQISLVLSSTPPSLSNETKVVIIMDSTAGKLGWQNEKQQLTVHALPDLAKDTEAKKITWSFLKEVKI